MLKSSRAAKPKTESDIGKKSRISSNGTKSAVFISLVEIGPPPQFIGNIRHLRPSQGGVGSTENLLLMSDFESELLEEPRF